MDQGEIAFTHRLGEQGGYGVIKGSDGKEYIFILTDVTNYFGGDPEKVGMRAGSPVHYLAIGNMITKVLIVR